ncbi:hypothetical protein KMC73_gp67 [Paenibacillus phage Wanderer]|uniref:Uncharacterized protein n=2 Tax=Wanderervirus wanderer TaxID=2845749 RepID=A0A345ARN6_9CAUD|nr:hypothetical protein KMC73_gp67 [Paenibacillus phage Wanderer]AXF39490.1 hypothetical protein WANDERER_67 [Paenibacillus phage Wanderer]AXF40374.1 hypothetical protein LINCOLNB_67 [Paenibacillus phage LincolnB]
MEVLSEILAVLPLNLQKNSRFHKKSGGKTAKTKTRTLDTLGFENCIWRFYHQKSNENRAKFWRFNV